MVFMIAFYKENKSYNCNWSDLCFRAFQILYIEIDRRQLKRYIYFYWYAPIHKASLIAELCKSTNLCIITIVPYSPFLNPTEKLILFIKSKIWKIQKNRKLITLKVIQKIIDDITERSLSKWISDSKIETINLIRKFLS